jgi:hypothetical protein
MAASARSKHLDQVISQHQRIRHRLERQGIRRTGNESVIRRGAERDHQLVVRQAVRGAFGTHGSNDLVLHINRFDRGFDEASASKGSADGLRAVSQLQPSGACLEHEWGEHENILAAHQRDLDIFVSAQHPLQVSHGGDAAESAAEYNNAHVPSRNRPGYQLISASVGSVARPRRPLPRGYRGPDLSGPWVQCA